MKLILATMMVFINYSGVSAQISRKVSTYLLTQYNNTLYDRTAGNNPWGIGLGIQGFYNNGTRFKPTLELTGDVYLEDDKVLRLNADGAVPLATNDIGGMVNLFAGVSYHPNLRSYFSFTAGPSFISGKTLLGIKPSLGWYFSNSQKWTGKISYINIFNRDSFSREDFGSISVGVGLKLF